jgi:hypothetical protein
MVATNQEGAVSMLGALFAAMVGKKVNKDDQSRVVSKENSKSPVSSDNNDQYANLALPQQQVSTVPSAYVKPGGGGGVQSVFTAAPKQPNENEQYANLDPPSQQLPSMHVDPVDRGNQSVFTAAPKQPNENDQYANLDPPSQEFKADNGGGHQSVSFSIFRALIIFISRHMLHPRQALSNR